MSPDEIADEAIKKINRKITDLVFLEIQNDRDLMRAYLRQIDGGNKLDSTNRAIGKRVKQKYKLTNADQREHQPTSTLILSHQIFE